LKVTLAAQPDAPLHRRSARQPLAALASTVLHHAHAAPVAHSLQEAVYAFAIPLLGLKGSLDSSPPRGVQKPMRTAVVYKTDGSMIVIPLV
jgi:hypothetical protein